MTSTRSSENTITCWLLRLHRCYKPPVIRQDNSVNALRLPTKIIGRDLTVIVTSLSGDPPSRAQYALHMHHHGILNLNSSPGMKLHCRWLQILRSSAFASAFLPHAVNCVRFCFGAVCDFFVCVRNISRTAKRICAKFTETTCLVSRSDDFEGQGQFRRPACG